MIELTDGELSVTFDGGLYSISSWSPAIPRRLSDGTYEQVIERMRINIHSPGGGVMAAYDRLVQLVQRARSHYEGETSRPVWCNWTIGSSLWRAMLIIPPTLENPRPPGNFALAEKVGTLSGVDFQFQRRGGWHKQIVEASALVNGSFESWSGGLPVGWSSFAGVTEEATIVYHGAKSAKMTVVDMGSASLWQDIDNLYMGATYRVSAMVYVESAAYSSFIMRVAGEEEAEVQARTTFLDDWQRLEVLVKPGNSINYTDGLRISFQPELNMPAVYYVDEVQLEMISGPASGGDIAYANSVPNGTPATVRFASGEVDNLSPTYVGISGFRVGTRHQPAYVVVSSSKTAIRASNIWTIDAATLITAGDFSKVSDTAAFPLGTQVVRYTPAGVSWQSLTFLNYASELSRATRLAVIAVVRNNSSTTSFLLRGLSFLPTGNYYTQPLLIAPQASARPEVVLLGELPLPRLGNFFLQAKASAASGTLDIDRIVLVLLDEARTSIVRFDGGVNIAPSTEAYAGIDHAWLTAFMPRLEITTSLLATQRWSGHGDMSVMTNSELVEAVLVATGGASNANRWHVTAGGTEAIVENDWLLSRSPISPTPK